MLKRFISNLSGVSAVEFALISPLLVLFYFATVEIDSALTVDRRVTSVANSVADLVAQDDIIDNAELADIFTAARAIMAPYDDSDDIEIRVSSLRLDPQNRPRVVWSQGHNMGGLSAGAQADAPVTLFDTNGTLIMAEAVFDYDAPLAQFLDGTLTMTETFYLRPRRSAAVCLSSQNGPIC